MVQVISLNPEQRQRIVAEIGTVLKKKAFKTDVLGLIENGTVGITSKGNMILTGKKDGKTLSALFDSEGKLFAVRDSVFQAPKVKGQEGTLTRNLWKFLPDGTEKTMTSTITGGSVMGSSEEIARGGTEWRHMARAGETGNPEYIGKKLVEMPTTPEFISTGLFSSSGDKRLFQISRKPETEIWSINNNPRITQVHRNMDRQISIYSEQNGIYTHVTNIDRKI